MLLRGQLPKKSKTPVYPSRLLRCELPCFGDIRSDFSSHLMRADGTSLEVLSARKIRLRNKIPPEIVTWMITIIHDPSGFVWGL